MALSMSGHPVLDPIQTIYGPADALGQPAPTATKAQALDVSDGHTGNSARWSCPDARVDEV
jgi:hypothetical protein